MNLSDQINSHKKILLFGGVISIIVIFILTNIFSKNSSYLPSPSQKSTPPQFYQITPTPSPAESQTGALTNSDDKYIKEHPELKVEAKLRTSTPIQGSGFVINFSYAKDKFLVTITQPYSTNYNNFRKWFSDQGLKDLSHFEISYGVSAPGVE